MLWSRIENAFTAVDRRREKQARLDLLDRLDQATLTKAFRGELVERQQP